MRTTAYVGALMAGGTALRFGGLPKGLALIGGHRIADRVLAALRSTTDEQIVVANDPRAVRWFPGERVVADETPDLGPLAGLRTALVAATGRPLIVVAWDMPFVTAALLAALRTLADSGAGAAAPCARPMSPIEPLCACYGGDALGVCEALLARGSRRAGALFDALPMAMRLEGPPLDALGDPSVLLRSIDTPDDLASVGGSFPDSDATARR